MMTYKPWPLKESRLAEIASTLEEMLESLSEEEKEQDTVKESKDGFASAELNKAAKVFLKEQKASKVKFAEESYEAKIIRANKLIDEEKNLKKTVKNATTALHLKTKTTIEALTDEQVNNSAAPEMDCAIKRRTRSHARRRN
ncbi:hypothetical protein ACVXG7_03330 [Enterobacter hormaechei]